MVYEGRLKTVDLDSIRGVEEGLTAGDPLLLGRLGPKLLKEPWRMPTALLEAPCRMVGLSG